MPATPRSDLSVVLWHSDDHRQDVDDLMSHDRPDVADRGPATFDGDGAELLDESATWNVKSVDLVRLDRYVTRKAPRSRRERYGQEGGGPVPKKGVSDDDDSGPDEARLGANGRSEVNENDVAEVQASPRSALSQASRSAT